MTEYRAILAEIDEEWRRIAARYNFGCKRCGDCCRGPVPVSRYIEALILLEHFRQLNKSKQSEILRRARLYKLEAKRRGYPTYPSMPLFGVQIFAGQVTSDLRGIACPLLSDDNTCELYKVRPTACRTYGLPEMGRLPDCFPYITGLTIDDIDEFVNWLPFHMKISELELLLPGAGNWKTRFVADVLLLAEKKRANRDVPNIEFKNRHAPPPLITLRSRQMRWDSFVRSSTTVNLSASHL